MSRSILERDVLEAFNRANQDQIYRDLDDLDHDFEYLFQTPPLPVHNVG